MQNKIALLLVKMKTRTKRNEQWGSSTLRIDPRHISVAGGDIGVGGLGNEYSLPVKSSGPFLKWGWVMRGRFSPVSPMVSTSGGI